MQQQAPSHWVHCSAKSFRPFMVIKVKSLTKIQQILQRFKSDDDLSMLIKAIYFSGPPINGIYTPSLMVSLRLFLMDIARFESV